MSWSCLINGWSLKVTLAFWASKSICLTAGFFGSSEGSVLLDLSALAWRFFPLFCLTVEMASLKALIQSWSFTFCFFILFTSRVSNYRLTIGVTFLRPPVWDGWTEAKSETYVTAVLSVAALLFSSPTELLRMAVATLFASARPLSFLEATSLPCGPSLVAVLAN